MGWRRVVEELEADLYLVPLPRFFRFEKGEVERKRYEDGEERLEVSFRGLKAPDGAPASVRVNGVEACTVAVRGGRGKLEISSRDGRAIPPARSGDAVEIVMQGVPLLRGTFRPD